MTLEALPIVLGLLAWAFPMIVLAFAVRSLNHRVKALEDINAKLDRAP